MRLPQDRIMHIDTELAGGEVRVTCEWKGEIVRCKDCKHFDPDGANTDGWGWCNKNDSDWRVDDFCSWGKRGRK